MPLNVQPRPLTASTGVNTLASPHDAKPRAASSGPVVARRARHPGAQIPGPRALLTVLPTLAVSALAVVSSKPTRTGIGSSESSFHSIDSHRFGAAPSKLFVQEGAAAMPHLLEPLEPAPSTDPRYRIVNADDRLPVDVPPPDAKYQHVVPLMKGAANEATTTKVKWLNEEERKQYLVTPRDGLLYNAKGELFDTTDVPTEFNVDMILPHVRVGGRMMYVMDYDGNIYSGPATDGTLRHSSFLNGKSVAAAGEWVVVQGKRPELVNSVTGHYRVAIGHMDQFCDNLRSHGITGFQEDRGNPRMSQIKGVFGNVWQVQALLAVGAACGIAGLLQTCGGQQRLVLTPGQRAATDAIDALDAKTRGLVVYLYATTGSKLDTTEARGFCLMTSKQLKKALGQLQDSKLVNKISRDEFELTPDAQFVSRVSFSLDGKPGDLSDLLKEYRSSVNSDSGD